MSGEEWFITNPANGLSQVYKDSHVETFVDAEEYYTDLRKEVEATKAGGFICWIGFEGHGDTWMPKAAASKKVKGFPPRKSVDGETRSSR